MKIQSLIIVDQLQHHYLQGPNLVKHRHLFKFTWFVPTMHIWYAIDNVW